MKKFCILFFVMLFLPFALNADPEMSDVEHQKDDVSGMYDPWYGFNKRMYRFNYYFDKYLFLPVTNGYEYITPDPVEDCVSNFFSNLGEVNNFVNCLLQGKFKGAGKTFGRFALNSTFGILGVFDVSTDMGIRQQREDFGQTLATYGVEHGPYLVLPIFGPSTVRDGVGIGVDTLISYPVDPFHFQDQNAWMSLPSSGLKGVDARHRVKFRYYETGSPFEYEMVRMLYYKKRKLDVSK